MVAAFLLVIIFFLVKCSNQYKVKQPTYLATDPSNYYVGKEQCRSCHADIYDQYIQTGMGQSFGLASANKSAAKFQSTAAVYDEYRNFYYHPSMIGDSMYITEFRLLGKDTIYKRREKVDYIVGSGQHTNSHLINRNGRVYQAPCTFYTQEGKWDLPPGFEGGFNSRFSRSIQSECMTCHNAYPKQVAGSDNLYTYVANGIDCERCHGPGGKHVASKQKGEIIDTATQIDYSIVNPSKLPIALQLDVCQRCHIQGNAVLKSGKDFEDFKPSMKLSDVMDVYMPVYEGRNDDHIMASHVERMKLSKCYRVSIEKAEKMASEKSVLKPYANAMTCISCHNPHITVKQTGSNTFNAACLKCHASKLSRDFICRGDNVGKDHNCVGCHMPKNSTIDIPHVKVTDHYIRTKYKATAVDSIKKFIGLACINNPHADTLSKAEAWLNYYEKFDDQKSHLDSAKVLLADFDSKSVKRNFRLLIRWSFLKGDYYTIVKYCNMVDHAATYLTLSNTTNDDAWTAYRIAIAYEKVQPDSAKKYHAIACGLAPLVSDFSLARSIHLINMGAFAEATTILDSIIKYESSHVKALVNRGFMDAKALNFNRALQYYSQALKLDPDNKMALMNSAAAHFQLRQFKPALEMLLRIKKMDPADGQISIMINSVTKSMNNGGAHAK
ncbi:MAG: hypothetical protein RIQ89_2405 [Bacteroidota bacterium]